MQFQELYKRAVLFRRLFGHIRKEQTKEALIPITLRVLLHRCKLIRNYAACPFLSRRAAGLIASRLVGLWENLENMTFGAQFYAES